MSRRWTVFAWSILASVFVGMSVYLLLHPTRTGVVPNYRFAVASWWGSTSMYPGGTHGFLYAPPFAVLFSPLHFLRPEVLGELLWRALGFGLFCWGLWSLARVSTGQPGRGENSDPAFFWIVLLALPASLASLNNGQTNLPLSACLVFSALALRRLQWNRAALLLSLSLVLKPTALAPWLLAFAVIPAMRIPLILGLSAFGLIGFLHPNPLYASQEWVEFFEKISHSYTPENLRVSDIFGSFGRAGLVLQPPLEKAFRAFACLATLVWVWRSFVRRGLPGVSWALWVSAALVFTIFNPRAETNSYVLISPLLAFTAIGYWRGNPGEKWKGFVLAAACFGLMCDGMGKPIYLATDVWFKPLVVILVSPLLFRVPEAWRAEGLTIR
ncbi:MAG: DUF2029 domain-containing protein [Verrucomicrobia bacterium]|nr:DUF2029 domain-containing protein [Verrucomicrobiota bacterium]NBR62924.1 DUF2029 domain-containing protein [Verrucomicrobiota bacterium]